MDMKVGCVLACAFHDWRGRRYDPQPTAMSDPVYVPVAMHHDNTGTQPLQLPDEPRTVDQRGSDPLRECLGKSRILGKMVMQRHDPDRIGKLSRRKIDAFTLAACTAAIPESARISRNRRPGLIGSSSLAGFAGSTTLMS